MPHLSCNSRMYTGLLAIGQLAIFTVSLLLTNRTITPIGYGCPFVTFLEVLIRSQQLSLFLDHQPPSATCFSYYFGYIISSARLFRSHTTALPSPSTDLIIVEVTWPLPEINRLMAGVMATDIYITNKRLHSLHLVDLQVSSTRAKRLGPGDHSHSPGFLASLLPHLRPSSAFITHLCGQVRNNRDQHHQTRMTTKHLPNTNSRAVSYQAPFTTISPAKASASTS